MTAQEILKMDSTIFLQVGATQLQKILSTLKMYKVNLEVAEEALVAKNKIIEELRIENKKLRDTSITIRSVGEITGY
jgi:predicted transcriptional regulator